MYVAKDSPLLVDAVEDPVGVVPHLAVDALVVHRRPQVHLVLHQPDEAHDLAVAVQGSQKEGLAQSAGSPSNQVVVALAQHQIPSQSSRFHPHLFNGASVQPPPDLVVFHHLLDQSEEADLGGQPESVAQRGDRFALHERDALEDLGELVYHEQVGLWKVDVFLWKAEVGEMDERLEHVLYRILYTCIKACHIPASPFETSVS